MGCDSRIPRPQHLDATPALHRQEVRGALRITRGKEHLGGIGTGGARSVPVVLREGDFSAFAGAFGSAVSIAGQLVMPLRSGEIVCGNT